MVFTRKEIVDFPWKNVSLPEGIRLKCPTIFGASVWPRATRNSRWSFTKVWRRPRSSENVWLEVGWGPFVWTPDFDEQNIWKNPSVWISVWFSKVMWSQRWNFWFMILPFIHFDHRNMYDMNWPFINSCHKKSCRNSALTSSFRAVLELTSWSILVTPTTCEGSSWWDILAVSSFILFGCMQKKAGSTLALLFWSFPHK